MNHIEWVPYSCCLCLADYGQTALSVQTNFCTARSTKPEAHDISQHHQRWPSLGHRQHAHTCKFGEVQVYNFPDTGAYTADGQTDRHTGHNTPLAESEEREVAERERSGKRGIR